MKAANARSCLQPPARFVGTRRGYRLPLLLAHLAVLQTLVPTGSAVAQAPSPPRINPTTSLQSRAAEVGLRTVLTVNATGTAPLSYQWRLNGRFLEGATTGTLRLDPVKPEDEGDYLVEVSNASGTATSEPARLYVVPPLTEFIREDFTNAAGLRLPWYHHLPAAYDPARKYPVVIGFHGAPNDEVSFMSPPSQYLYPRVLSSYGQQAANPVIAVWPTRRKGDHAWTDPYLQLVADLVDSLPARFGIDTNRLYLRGVSEGGHAVWDLLALRPGKFAAANIYAGEQGKARAATIQDVPLWLFHAADDFPDSSRVMVRQLRQAGGNPIYTEYQSGGHFDAILMAFVTAPANDWLLSQRLAKSSPSNPLLEITLPVTTNFQLTGATTASLSGTAQGILGFVSAVNWENFSNGAKGTASGSNSWNAVNIRLQPDRTNAVVVTATTRSGAPAFRGGTTFNDTLRIVSRPVRLSLQRQPQGLLLDWTGGVPPFRIQSGDDLADGDWRDIPGPLDPPVILPAQLSHEFFRIVGQ